jgi:hypothetical protein
MMQQGVKLKIRKLWEFETKFEKNLGYESEPKMDTFDEKNQSCKISHYCTFKQK